MKSIPQIIAIDPGPEKSALVVFDGERIVNAYWDANEYVLARLGDWDAKATQPALVIEKVASFGMPVGAEVFETVYWSGRFAEAYGAEHVHRITRIEVKNHLCHSSRARDSNIRQALIDKFGGKAIAIGNKRSPGPLFGITGDLWSSLAVAVTFWEIYVQKTKSVRTWR